LKTPFFGFSFHFPPASIKSIAPHPPPLENHPHNFLPPLFPTPPSTPRKPEHFLPFLDSYSPLYGLFPLYASPCFLPSKRVTVRDFQFFSLCELWTPTSLWTNSPVFCCYPPPRRALCRPVLPPPLFFFPSTVGDLHIMFPAFFFFPGYPSGRMWKGVTHENCPRLNVCTSFLGPALVSLTPLQRARCTSANFLPPNSPKPPQQFVR